MEQRTYALVPAEDDERLLFCREESDGEWTAVSNLLDDLPLTMGPRVQAWGAADYRDELNALAERCGLPLAVCGKRFGQVQLAERDAVQGWSWHPLLGFKRRC